MFCFRADALLEAAQSACPDVLAAVRACHASAISHESPVEYSREAFAAMPDISIDYAIMERASRRAVVAASFDWSDIGSWKAVSEIVSDDTQPDAAGNRVHGKAVDGRPSLRYLRLLRDGARAHGLPPHYIRFLESVEHAR